MKYIYVITVFRERDYLDSRTWGWYSSFGAAENAVLGNHNDLFENYDMAVIEQFPEGLGTVATKGKFYAKTHLRADPVVCAEPECLKGICNLGMG